MKDFTLQLAANTPREIRVPARAYHIQEAAGPVKLSFDHREVIIREKTQGGIVGEFQLVRVESTTPQTVTISLGNDVTVDGRAELASATIETTIENSNLINQVPDVVVTNAATLLMAANTSRKEILIQVPDDAPNGIRIGSASVASDRGLKVGPGRIISLHNEAGIYGIRDGAADVTVSVIENLRA